jgi:putative ABC transport system permease protein
MDYWLYRQEIAQNANVLGISACSHLPGVSTNRWIDLYEEKRVEPLAFIYLSVDFQFLENLKIPLLAGNNFRNPSSFTNNQFILINQLAAQKLGFKRPADALGQGLTTKNGEILEIIGVTGDFSQNSLQDSIKPSFIQMVPSDFRHLNIRVNARNRVRTIEFLQTKWEQLFPGIPFHYASYTEQMEAEYEAAQLIPGIIRFFAAIAILISCLGLLGITDYSAKIRTKEIGIRKVFGANLQSLIGILSREFIYMLSISISLAIPTAYYLNKALLKLYERQVPIKIEFFILGGLLMMMLGLFTIFSQTLKVAQTNPVDTLKYE